MQAIGETLFDIVYLTTVITLGIVMIRRSRGVREIFLFGLMAVVLGSGDAFHLVPRAVALCTTGLSSFTVSLGIGKLVTSISMTIFYLLLYQIWRERYQIKGRGGLSAAIYSLAAARIVLCLLPQNRWTSADAPLSWGILRNLPFAVLGLIIIVIYFSESRKNNDRTYRHMWLAVLLSFGFYIPVVLWADAVPAVGMLMIPKTCAYVWMVLIGYYSMRDAKCRV